MTQLDLFGYNVPEEPSFPPSPEPVRKRAPLPEITRPLMDDDPMPFGKYAGEKMISVSYQYLCAGYVRNAWSGYLLEYVEDLIDRVNANGGRLLENQTE
jgi:uncharacterized protein (DUF3820 family)